MATHSELRLFADSKALALAAAADLMASVTEVVKLQGRFSLALSGGRIAQAFYAALVEKTRADGAWRLWADVDFFWADERCVAPDDPESNYRGAVEWLLNPLGIAPERVHRIQGELEPGTAAELAAEDLAGVARGRAVFLDLVILGMGEDGHVASLFPGESPEPGDAPLFRSVVAVKPPPKRVTLSYGAIKGAREVWVLASGQGKQSALRASLEGTETPLGKVRVLRSQLRIYTDVK